MARGGQNKADVSRKKKGRKRKSGGRMIKFLLTESVKRQLIKNKSTTNAFSKVSVYH